MVRDGANRKGGRTVMSRRQAGLEVCRVWTLDLGIQFFVGWVALAPAPTRRGDAQALGVLVQCTALDPCRTL